jgi:adenylate kinase family enzyme
MALNLIMLGPPGAGKGTQAERFARGRGIPKVSTGDILRDAVHERTETGNRVKAIMERGELVSDEVMIPVVRERLERPDARAGFVLDGFPRTVAQAEALDSFMEGRGPLIVVDIVVPEAEIVRRLGSRMICADCGANGGAAGASRDGGGGGGRGQRPGGIGVLPALRRTPGAARRRQRCGRPRALEGVSPPDRTAGAVLPAPSDVPIGERRAIAGSGGGGAGACD